MATTCRIPKIVKTPEGKPDPVYKDLVDQFGNKGAYQIYLADKLGKREPEDIFKTSEIKKPVKKGKTYYANKTVAMSLKRLKGIDSVSVEGNSLVAMRGEKVFDYHVGRTKETGLLELEVDQESSSIDVKGVVYDKSKIPFFMEDMGRRLSKRFGVDVSYINDPSKDFKGMFTGNGVVINLAHAKEDTLWHEFAHPLVEIIRRDHPQLYSKLKQEVFEDDKATKIFQEVAANRPDLKAEEALMDEVITEIIGRRASNKYKHNNRLEYMLKKLYRTLKSVFRKVTGLKDLDLDRANLDSIVDIYLDNSQYFKKRYLSTVRYQKKFGTHKKLQRTLGILDKHDSELNLEEENHVYTRKGKVVKGATEVITSNEFVAPFNKEELVENKFRKRIIDLRKLEPSLVTEESKKQELEAIKRWADSLENVADIGTDFHKAMEVGIDGNSDSSVNEALEYLIQSKHFPTAGSDVFDKKFKAGFEKVIKQIRSVSGPSSRILSERKLFYDGSKKGKDDIAGTADVISVRPDGSIDIFDFKTSYKKFDEWNEYKSKTIAHQMQLYKNMAESMGLTVNAIHIIPIEMDVDLEAQEALDFRVGDIQSVKTLGSVDVEELKKRIDSVAPVEKSYESFSYDGNKNVEKALSSLFDYDIITSEDESENFKGSKEEVDKALKNSKKYKNYWHYRYEQYLSTGKTFFFDRYSGKDGKGEGIDLTEDLKGDLNEADVKKIFKEKFFKSFKNYTDYKNSQYDALIDIVKSRQSTIDEEAPDPIIFKNKTSDFNRKLYNVLEKYIMDSKYRVLEIQGFKELGIVAFKHETTDEIEFINLTNKDLDERLSLGEDKKGKVLSKFIKSSRLTHKDVPDAFVHNIEAYKVMLAAIDAGLHEKGKLGNIINVTISKSNPKLILPMTSKDALDQLGMVAKSKYTSAVKDTLVEKIKNMDPIVVSDPLDSVYNYISNILQGDNAPSSNLFDVAKEAKLLKKSESTLLKKYIEARNAYGNSPTRQAKSELYSIITDIITTLEKTKGFMTSDDEKSTKGNKTYSELLFILKEARLYLGHGLGGFATDVKQFGTLFDNNFMFNASSDLKNPIQKKIKAITNKSVATIQSKFIHGFRKDHTKVLNKVYKEGTNPENAGRKITGNYKKAFDNLFELDKNGNKTMRLRDPQEGFGDTTQYDYKSRGQKPLNKAEREYIEFFINTTEPIKKERIGDFSIISSDPKRYSEWRREIPLMRATPESVAVDKGIGKGLKEFVTGLTKIDQELSGDDYEEQFNQRERAPDLFAYYDSNPDARNDKISEVNSGDLDETFETNLEFVLDVYKLTEIKVKEYNKILPVINDIKDVLFYRELKYNNTTESLRRFIELESDKLIYKKRAKLSSRQDVSPEVDAAAEALSGFTYMFNLGFNVTTGITQMFQGFYALAKEGFAETLRDGSPSKANYFKAFNIMLGESALHMTNITKTNELNKLYSINEDLLRDPSFISDRNSGLLAMRTRWMNWMSTSPDYFYRMIILIAHMEKDGNWAAHKINENGELTYDVTKDKRFSLIFNKDGSLKEKKNLSSKAGEQRALYDTIVQELEEEGAVDPETGKPLQAYPSKEINSIKKVGDNIFGSYTEKDKAIASRFVGWRLILQFKTWIMAKKREYWDNPTGKFSEVMGTRKVEAIRDENGNHMKDENGEYMFKVYWEASYHEGIFNTIYFMIKDLDFSSPGSFANSFRNYKDWDERVKKRRIANLRRFLSDAIIMALVALVGNIIGKDDPRAKILYNSAKDLWFMNNLGTVSGKYNPISALSFTHGFMEDVFGATMEVGSGNYRGAGKTLLGTTGVGRMTKDVYALAATASE